MRRALSLGLDRWGGENGATVVFTPGSEPVMQALRASGLALRLNFSDAAEDLG